MRRCDGPVRPPQRPPDRLTRRPTAPRVRNPVPESGGGPVGGRGRLAVRPARIRRTAPPLRLAGKLRLAAKPQRTAVLTGYLLQKPPRAGSLTYGRSWMRASAARGLVHETGEFDPSASGLFSISGSRVMTATSYLQSGTESALPTITSGRFQSGLAGRFRYMVDQILNNGPVLSCVESAIVRKQ